MPPSTACLSRGGAGTASLRAAVTARRARCVSHATAARRAPVRVAAQQGLAVVHIYETLQKPALFESFLEGMTHVLEVARYHPGFKTANVHTCLDQEALDAGAPFSYLNFSVFEAAPGVSSLAELSEPHSDWMTSMEFGHDGQEHHPILVREVAAIPESKPPPIEQALEGGFSCDQDDVVVVVATCTGGPDKWQEWSGVSAFAQRDDFRSAALYQSVSDGEKYSHIVRSEFANVDHVDLDSLAEQLGALGDGGDTLAVAYRSLVHVAKDSEPVDLLFANRAKEAGQT
eukprot:jgi/Tetstr1/430841/TSEL_020622.t1